MSQQNVFFGKKVILGVCGGIAAYKAVLLLRLLVRAGADVKVVMTEAARAFVGPVTFAALSGNPVETALFDAKTGVWHNHIELGLWADVLIIAPATSGALARAATGQATDLLTAIYLSARCPVMFCPAMDLDMYAHPAVQANLATLRGYGNRILEPASGELASGLNGVGRLPDPEEIVEAVRGIFTIRTAWVGKHVLITAGPTREMIDPVRYLGNLSSGKMGYALAREAAALGANVTLVSGHSDEPLPGQGPRLARIWAYSTQAMLAACQAKAPTADLILFAAAVADYMPENKSDTKTKKSGDHWHLNLKETPDIAATLAAARKPGQLLVGFALEHGHDTAPAKSKLARKGLDAIAFNSLDQGETSVLGGHQNEITIVFADGRQLALPKADKTTLATQIFDALEPLL